MSVSGENDDVAALADSNQNLGPRGEDPKEVEADDGAKSGKPLKIRSVRLEKSVRLPKLDGIIKEFNRLVKDSGSIFSSASKAIDRAQADADQQIDRRFKESNKSLNRIKDANKRNDLAKKLTTEVDEARASIRKFLDQQKATIEKVMTADNLYEDGVKLIEKAKQTQTSIFEKLAAMGPKMSSTIQSSFAKASSVMDEIAKKWKKKKTEASFATRKKKYGLPILLTFLSLS